MPSQRRHAYSGALFAAFVSLTTILSAIAESLPETATIHGRVVTYSNQPVEYATVRALGTRLGGVTDEHGAFSISRVPVGACTLKVQSPGLDSDLFPIRVVSGDTASLTLRLPAIWKDLHGNGSIVPGVPDTTWIESLRSSGRPIVYRIGSRYERPQLAQDGSAYQWAVVDSILSPSEDWTGRLIALLLEPMSYTRLWPEEVKMLCSPYPNIVVRFPTSPGPTDVFVCLGCADLWFGPRTSSHVGGRFPSLSDGYRALALEAYPNHPGIRRPGSAE